MWRFLEYNYQYKALLTFTFLLKITDFAVMLYHERFVSSRLGDFF